MNPDTGAFHAEDPPPKQTVAMDPLWPRFSIGQVIDVNGTAMVVKRITRKDLVLRPVPRQRDPSQEHIRQIEEELRHLRDASR